jgi:tetratricopeptide (TPR) repeat protein
METSREIVLGVSSAIASLLIAGLIASAVIFDYLYKRLDKPKMLQKMRLLCRAEKWLLVFFVPVSLVRLAAGKPSNLTVSCLITVGFIAFCLYNWFKYHRYYLLNRDDRKVFGGWHCRRYYDLCKKDKFRRAYEHLEKASEFIIDNVYIWVMLAFSHRNNTDHSVSDSYLVKAREALQTSSQPAQDEAHIENVTGKILLCRNQIAESLPHFKKACDLWPENQYSTECYEKALQCLNEPDAPEDDSQDESSKIDDEWDEPEDADCPFLLDGLSHAMIIIGSILIVLLSYSFVKRMPSWQDQNRVLSSMGMFIPAALLFAGLISGGALCLNIKKPGWHVLSFSTFALALKTSEFLFHTVKSKGLVIYTVPIAFFSLLLICAYVYLFTDQPRAFLKVRRPRWQIFLLHIAFYVAAHALVTFLRQL